MRYKGLRGLTPGPGSHKTHTDSGHTIEEVTARRWHIGIRLENRENNSSKPQVDAQINPGPTRTGMYTVTSKRANPKTASLTTALLSQSLDLLPLDLRTSSLSSNVRELLRRNGSVDGQAFWGNLWGNPAETGRDDDGRKTQDRQ